MLHCALRRRFYARHPLPLAQSSIKLLILDFPTSSLPNTCDNYPYATLQGCEDMQRNTGMGETAVVDVGAIVYKTGVVEQPRGARRRMMWSNV